MHSLYHSTKWAVEGFSESLRFEADPLGIYIKIVEPGLIKTPFYDQLPSTSPAGTGDYDVFIDDAEKATKNAGEGGSDPIVVAKTIFQAATDGS